MFVVIASIDGNRPKVRLKLGGLHTLDGDFRAFRTSPMTEKNGEFNLNASTLLLNGTKTKEEDFQVRSQRTYRQIVETFE